MGDTGNGLVDKNAINELDAKHDYYADELEKIKAMLKWRFSDSAFIATISQTYSVYMTN